VPNLLFIRYGDKRKCPLTSTRSPSADEAVVWSLVGPAGRAMTRNETRPGPSGRFPNIVGFVMDDFFKKDGTGSLSVEQLRPAKPASHQREAARSVRVLYQHSSTCRSPLTWSSAQGHLLDVEAQDLAVSNHRLTV